MVRSISRSPNTSIWRTNMDTIEELRDEYDRLSDQGRDTHSITAAIEAVFNTPNPKLSAVYTHTTELTFTGEIHADQRRSY
jgi:hypothetical protein